MRCGAKTLRRTVRAANDLHCVRIATIETSGEHIAQRLEIIINMKVKGEIEETLELSEGFRGAHNTMIGVVSTRKVIAV